MINEIQQQGPFVLVTGASRGIGLHLVQAFLARQPHAVIFASVRDPAGATALNDLAAKHSNIHVIQLAADDEESNKKAVEEIKKLTDRLDIVVANAGIGSPHRHVHLEDPAVYKEVWSTNTLGPLHLYQATSGLLMASRADHPNLSAPKFFITSSKLASMGAHIPMPVGAYGASKVAVNYLAVSIHHQTEQFGAVIVPYHPGVVCTDMIRESAKDFGMRVEDVPGLISPEQSAAEYIDLILKATRAEHGGRFLGQGFASPIPW
ncbi:hypothetical protein QFC21_006654 [Naganishia friedmannii]|uniref:Uncharacterized protein n=1 Tax=Naganishia friedmannii TaxID=89922 RepID=A0ACC2V0X3_9TREE|nr:hypothetical protein QFC21_006654 [Naganishia friedmannii]